MTWKKKKDIKLGKISFHLCLDSSNDSNFSTANHQGPVVQSIVSLTSSLRGQLVKCFMTL